MTTVELHFPFTGATLPSDQGYALYGAISRLIPETHEADWLAIETVPGTARGDGITQLDQSASLKLRLPQDQVPLLLKLSGKRLDLNGHAIRLGAPQIFLLQPSPQLYARIVTIKGFTEKEPFREAVYRQLDKLGVSGEAEVGERRVLKVGNHTIVGFGLTIYELTEEGSLTLQEVGIGGRRRMGCGIFNPINGREENNE